MTDTCLWAHTTKRVSLVFHVDDFLLAGTHQIITEIFTELSRYLELKSSEVTKPTRYLGTPFGKKAGRCNFGVDASNVESMRRVNMSALKSTPILRWERREKDEREMLASEKSVYPTASWKTVVD